MNVSFKAIWIVQLSDLIHGNKYVCKIDCAPFSVNQYYIWNKTYIQTINLTYIRAQLSVVGVCIMQYKYWQCQSSFLNLLLILI